jgi:hypothetical protein
MNHTAWAIAEQHADRLLVLLTDPAASPEALDHAADLARLWGQLAECLSPA